MGITFDPSGMIVVGTDLSGRAGAAVGWAAQRAADTGAPLLVVMALPAVPIPKRSRLFDAMGTGDWPGHLHETARHRLDELRAQVAERHPDLRLETRVEEGLASWVLAQASKRAALVVVGARGAQAPASVRALGGTADAVVAHAHGPVAVVTDLSEHDHGGDVVVGVDDSPEADAALRFAAAEASARGVGLLAVHAWDLTPYVTGPMGAAAFDTGPQKEALAEMVEEFLAPLRVGHPGLDARGEVVDGRASAILVEASRTASLVVVGARGLGGFTGLLLGSTSKEVLRDAHCPVVVIRAADRAVARPEG